MSCCHLCGATNDIRPYGVDAQMVCFPCAMGTPGGAAEAERQFAAQLRAVPGVALLDGTPAGPYPLKNNPKAAAACLTPPGERH